MAACYHGSPAAPANGMTGRAKTGECIDILTELESWYARENGQGMVFEPEDGEDEPPPGSEPPEPNKPEGRPSLKIVK